MKIKQMIVDADICLKIGASERFLFLENLLPKIAEKVYIHETVYNEIKYPAHVKSQIDNLIETGVIVKLNSSSLTNEEKILYQLTFDLLANYMMDRSKPNKNNGEVSSLAMAKVRGIPIFATDEMGLQPIVDKILNVGVDDITCLRIVDIIEKIKSGELSGLSRKEAKVLWVLSNKDKNKFDRIWPVPAEIGRT